MSEFYQELLPGNFYHIFNRGISREKIFIIEKNYFYFLNKFHQYLHNICETYSYCLLPNHFHFLVKIKESAQHSVKIPSFEKMESSFDPSESFRRFFISYAMSINKQQLRRGSLFIKNFKRKMIVEENDLRKAIFYIHFNPVYHNLRRDISSYKWSSFRSLISNGNTKLEREKVLKLFGGTENFLSFHNQKFREYEYGSIRIE